jgi:hypothetical protein
VRSLEVPIIGPVCLLSLPFKILIHTDRLHHQSTRRSVQQFMSLTMQRKPSSVVCLRRASRRRHRVNRSRRSSQRSPSVILMTVSSDRTLDVSIMPELNYTHSAPSKFGHGSVVGHTRQVILRFEARQKLKFKFTSIVICRSSKWCRPGVNRY